MESNAHAVEALTASLLDDERFGAIAALACELRPMLRLASDRQPTSHLPVGGYVDVSHRGELSRLTLSELAQDDDVLAGRIVLGEALYLKRERPRREAPRDLTIVVDAGVRTWGLVRPFAAAALLAAGASAEEGAKVSAFRADGETLLPIEFDSRTGLEQHLEAVTFDPHPGAALAQLSSRERTRVAVITGAHAIEDQRFRRDLDLGAKWHMIGLDDRGTLTLSEWQGGRLRQRRSARFSLSALAAAAPGESHGPG